MYWILGFHQVLWPFATLGWPDNKEYVDKFYPTSVLVTGFDIIFFWVATYDYVWNGISRQRTF